MLIFDLDGTSAAEPQLSFSPLLYELKQYPMLALDYWNWLPSLLCQRVAFQLALYRVAEP